MAAARRTLLKALGGGKAQREGALFALGGGKALGGGAEAERVQQHRRQGARC